MSALYLLPYQEDAVNSFIQRSGRMLLWGDPGVGKTAIALACAERAIRKYNRPVLFICPSIVKSQVKEDCEKFFPSLPCVVISGQPVDREYQWKEALSLLIAPIIVINYEQLLVDTQTILNIPWMMIVIDECHKTSSPTNKTTKLIKKMKSVPYRLAMSGTPTPNALHEYFSMIDWISPGVLGSSFYEFRRQWCKTHPYISQKIEGYYDEAKLRSIISTHVYRIQADDVLAELPKLTETVHYVTPTMDESDRYHTLKSTLVLELKDKQITIPNLLSCMMRLRQIVDCPRILGLEDVSSKEREAHKIIRGWLTDPKAQILVFAELAESLKHLCAEYPGASLILGETSHKDRQQQLMDFNTAKTRILFGSAAIQTGLNVQVATHILHFGVTWNQARMDQRTARAHRKGVTHPVTSVILLAKGTVDDHMYKLCKEKSKLSAKDLFTALNK